MVKNIREYKIFKAFIPVFLIVLVIILTCAYTSPQNRITDINNHWSKKYVEYLTNKGAINGYPDGTFRPDNNVTYGEAIKLIVATFNSNIDYGYPHWATNYLKYAKQTGIVPNNMNIEELLDANISRKEVVYMIYQSLIELANKPITQNDRTELELPFKDVTIAINNYGIDYYKTIKESYYLGIVIGHDTGLMKPEDSITRAEMATLMSRAYGEEMRIYPNTIVKSFLPNNNSVYRMVLAYMSNDFYEVGNSTFAKYTQGGTPYEYLDPTIRDATDIALNTTRINAEKAMNALINVSYTMSELEWNSWKQNIGIFNGLTKEQIEEYIEYVKENRIILMGGVLMNPATIGVFETENQNSKLGMKGYINFKIEYNPKHKKYLTIAEFVKQKQMISNIDNVKYVMMYLEEGTDISIYSLYNFKYNIEDVMYIGE